MRGVSSALAALLAVGGCSGGDEALLGTSLDGERLELFAESARVVVLFFVAPDCPISNRYVPEMNRLTAEFAADDVRTYVVYPGTAFSVEQVREHHLEFALQAPALLDPGYELVARASVAVTPEAAVFRSNGSLAYHGRIDNRFVDFGKTRPRATERDLVAAVDSVLDRREVAEPTAGPVGCYITAELSG